MRRYRVVECNPMSLSDSFKSLDQRGLDHGRLGRLKLSPPSFGSEQGRVDLSWRQLLSNRMSVAHGLLVEQA